MIISFLTNMILARMLTSYEFGQLGIVMFFISVANIFVDGGLGGALVRKQDSSENDYATVFTLNLIVSISLYILIFLFAGYISNFYEDHTLSNLFKIGFLVIIFNAFSLTQNTRLVASMDFKSISICKIISIIISSISAFLLASHGYGVWALIFMQVIYAFTNSILLNFVNGLYFRLYLSKKSVKELYGYGLNLSLSSLLNTAFDNVYQLIIGKYFSISLTGLYYQGKKLQEVPVNALNVSLQGPIFSFLAKKQSDKTAFVQIYSKINRLVILSVGLLSVIIYVYSKQIINLVYGKDWIDAAQFMRLLSLASFFFLLEMCNRVIFKVFDKTRLVLYLDIIKKVIQLSGIFLGIIFRNLEYLLVAFIVTSFIGYLINLYISRRVLEISGFNDFIYLFKTMGVIAVTIFVSNLFIDRFSFGNSLDLIFIMITILSYVILCLFIKLIDFQLVVGVFGKLKG